MQFADLLGDFGVIFLWQSFGAEHGGVQRAPEQTRRSLIAVPAPGS
jgi:hypothetical protein